MKKFVTILCMIACIFGLTACGGEEALTEYEQQKVSNAQQLADEMVQYLFAQYMTDEAAGSFDGYTGEEVEYMLNSQYGIYVDGNAFMSAADSFHAAKDSMGAITGTTGAKAEIDGSQIIVEVSVTGEKKNGTAEVIFSNDMFLTMESAAMNPSSTVGELMANAGLNTLIGMGTVFAVLILISLIISAFKVIPKIQESRAKKNAPKEEPAGIDNAVSRIVEQEAVEEEADDLELVAVIAAAIAASEGAVTTDGFVVRSVRKRR
ncbi:MAG: OadG family protein [Lachnospiraceae bacterium]|uniref:OadG family protein n=1 Tax=uncultured Acetatifactor sp. TaxID=1671927 RepID=UPI00260470A2|nr:OadG family protein [uncultured Acetatifactor sp.]MCI8790195.1 OadG family protein [Lachnospiraceae bacterium]